MFKRILRLVAIASLAASAWAHGFMSVPISRNIGSGTYCDQCLNAGGQAAVYSNGAKWPNGGKHGVCGDPASGELAGYHEGGGKFEKTVGIRVTYYQAGDVMKVKGTLTANHLGYLAYFLCVLPSNVAGGQAERAHLTNDCFKKNPLKVNQDGAWGDRYYIGSKVGEFENSVKLPDFECPRCVLRWYYITGNSCTPPGTPAKWVNSDLGICGNGWTNPEEFWNCADVTLLKKGQSLPAVSKLAIKGEVSTGVGSPVDSKPGDQTIEDADSGGLIGSPGGGGGSGGAGDNSIVSFQDVAISVVIGTGMGLPIVLISPLGGTALGMFAFIVAMMVFMFRNSRETYAEYNKKRY